MAPQHGVSELEQGELGPCGGDSRVWGVGYSLLEKGITNMKREKIKHKN